LTLPAGADDHAAEAEGKVEKKVARKLTLDWWTVIVGTAIAAVVLLGLPSLPF
jgi:hypothetical protein